MLGEIVNLFVPVIVFVFLLETDNEGVWLFVLEISVELDTVFVCKKLLEDILVERVIVDDVLCVLLGLLLRVPLNEDIIERDTIELDERVFVIVFVDVAVGLEEIVLDESIVLEFETEELTVFEEVVVEVIVAVVMIDLETRWVKLIEGEAVWLLLILVEYVSEEDPDIVFDIGGVFEIDVEPVDVLEEDVEDVVVLLVVVLLLTDELSVAVLVSIGHTVGNGLLEAVEELILEKVSNSVENIVKVDWTVNVCLDVGLVVTDLCVVRVEVFEEVGDNVGIIRFTFNFLLYSILRHWLVFFKGGVDPTDPIANNKKTQRITVSI